MRMIEPELELNRPFVVPRRAQGYVESNCVNAYVGEWVVFKCDIGEGDYIELRLPFERALEDGVVTCTNLEALDGDDD